MGSISNFLELPLEVGSHSVLTAYQMSACYPLSQHLLSHCVPRVQPSHVGPLWSARTLQRRQSLLVPLWGYSVASTQESQLVSNLSDNSNDWPKEKVRLWQPTLKDRKLNLNYASGFCTQLRTMRLLQKFIEKVKMFILMQKKKI